MKRKETLAERRIREARERGLFDNLSGAGEPSPDLDQQRPEGWWANRMVKDERSKLKRAELDEQVQLAMPALWRLRTEQDVRGRIDELNAEIRDYNFVTSLESKPLLQFNELVATWRRLGLAGS